MSEFLIWIKKEKIKILIYVLVVYIPLWIIVTTIWQSMDDNIEFSEALFIHGIVIFTIFLLIFGIYTYTIKSRIDTKHEFIEWIRKERTKIIIYALIVYIPLWITISAIWQILDEDHVDLTEFFIIQGLVILTLSLIITGIYKYSTRSKISDPKGKFIHKSNPLMDFMLGVKSRVSDYILYQRHKDEMFIEDLGWVKKCCNQTARLGERYCVCGRAVTKELYQLYSI